MRLGPSGIPIRGLGYAVLALGVVLVLNWLPITAPLLRLLPAPLVFIALPAITAAVLTLIRPGGRVFHVAARALASHALTPKTLHGLRRPGRGRRPWHPGPVVMLASGAEHDCRRLRFTGPGRVWIGRPHAQQLHRGGSLGNRHVDATLTELASTTPTGTGRHVTLRLGRTLEVRPATGRGAR
ncbi:hypothetical protein Q5424_01340 [Conexibacter sp. JD483]|uniref:hypothetical protein n=1 Tax=unclassified Conexibacter TaxID=2627773 RepID=UPI0027196DDC|nr:MULTISPECIES: hypothetical protein [unclassified Conexibacter]MDO8185874.1 hypothetical protein [Conexibacter sp. CPCC 205706]MDO8198617.1 hypothetical protein [Conexibacter sp. CPCC 205762]MDR9367703.1 hypothetical protein [Conexibacter sp. JD483]